MPHNRDMNINWNEALANAVNAVNGTDYKPEDFDLDSVTPTPLDEPEYDAEMFFDAKGYWPEGFRR